MTSIKPNISPLETEIESKLSTAYLFAIAAKIGQLNPSALFPEHIEKEKSNNQQLNKK